jgi:hypothetical protein
MIDKTGRAGAAALIKLRAVTPRPFTASRVDNPGSRADGDRLEPGGSLRRMTIL